MINALVMTAQAWTVAPAPAASPAATPPALPAVMAGDTACRKMRYANDPDTMSSAERNRSPLDSVTFLVGGAPVKICYSRPSSRGRTMLGGEAVPYGQFWRTGANEPTYLFTPIELSIAGLSVPAGSYSLYTLPGETEWRIIVNRSLTHWGFTLQKETQAQDVGSTTVEREWTPRHIETFTIRPEPDPAHATGIVLEWERTRVRIPMAPAGQGDPGEPVRNCARPRDWTLDLIPQIGLCHEVRKAASTGPATLPGGATPARAMAACPKQPHGGDTLPDALRQLSPLDSVSFAVSGAVGGTTIKLCYGRPAARGRVMLGGHWVPYGQLWRTGANEPTMLFTPIALSIAGLQVPPGAYSVYTIPGETVWVVIVNRSITHWGKDLSPTIQAQELGRVTVEREWTPQHIETFTIRPEPDAAHAKAIVFEWERTRVRIPLATR